MYERLEGVWLVSVLEGKEGDGCVRRMSRGVRDDGVGTVEGLRGLV